MEYNLLCKAQIQTDTHKERYKYHLRSTYTCVDFKFSRRYDQRIQPLDNFTEFEPLSVILRPAIEH